MRSSVGSRAVAGAIVLAAAALASAPCRGADELRIGSLQDLSGPLASAGKDARDGMRMAVDDINARGGIGGRPLRLLVEDHGYDPKRAVLATQKLLERDGIVAMVGQLGTATMQASSALLRQKNTLNFMPLTATALAYQPPQRLTFAYLPSYVDQLGKAIPVFRKQVGARAFCTIYQDDEFGQEILRGTEAALQAQGLPLVERASYKRGATDFSSQVARSAAAGCDAVVLGTVVRETVGVMAQARKIGFQAAFLATVSAYSATVPKLGGEDVEKLHATVVVDQPYADSGAPPLRDWAERYRAQFKEDPSVFSAQGYFVVESLSHALLAAGPQPSTDRLVAALERGPLPATRFGTPEMRFGSAQRLGIESVRLARIQQGRWVHVAE